MMCYQYDYCSWTYITCDCFRLEKPVFEKPVHETAYVPPTATYIHVSTRTGSRSRNFKRKCKFIQGLHNQR